MGPSSAAAVLALLRARNLRKSAFPPSICILLYKTEGGSEIPRGIPFLGYLCMLQPVGGRKRQRENLPGAGSPPAGAVSHAGLAPMPTAAFLSRTRLEPG